MLRLWLLELNYKGIADKELHVSVLHMALIKYAL